MQGFGARFLYFYEDGRAKAQPPERLDPTMVPPRIRFFIEVWTNREVKHENIDISSMNLTNPDANLKQMRKNSEKKSLIEKIKKPIPRELNFGPEVEEVLREVFDQFEEMKYKASSNIKPLVLRAYQNVIKISQIHWASRVFSEFQNDDSIPEEQYYSVKVEDVLWAKAYVEASLWDAARLFDETIIENRFHRETVIFKKFVRSNGGMVSKTQLTKRFKNSYRSEELYGLKGIVTALVNHGTFAEITKDSPAGRKKIAYKLIE